MSLRPLPHTYDVEVLLMPGLTPGRLFPRLAGVGDPQHIALTFDDGPHPVATPLFLAELDRLQVRATFFVLGRMLGRAPGVADQIVAAGHEIAIHGWDHRSVVLRTPATTRDHLARTSDAIESACGVRPTRYRPPYGVLTWGAWRSCQALGLTPVLWTAWGRDWRDAATPGSIRSDVSAQVAPGGTILLHDSDCTSAVGSWRRTLAALPGIVEDARATGAAVGPLSEHL